MANLTKADAENRFKKLFNEYYALLGDISVIPAAHLAFNSGKIALAKPKLQAKITNRLLYIDSTLHRHRDLVKASGIDALTLTLS